MNEKKTPRIRFKGFTDDWEQRKLGELYTERNERGNRSLQILSVSIHTGVSDGELDVDNLGKFIRRSEDKSTYKHVHSGDLIFNMMRAWQGAIGVAKTEGMISPAYISAIPSEDIYPPFMNYLLRRKNVINQINNLSYGVTDFRKRLYWNSFVQVNCKLPSVEEQRNITDVFEKIDNLITLHQRKYEKLQIIKKSMLENCFPKNGEKVPKIRFSGFTGDWEQRKVGEVIEDYVEKTTVQNQYPVLTSSQQQGIVLQEDYFADRQVTTNDNVGYYVLPRGYFTYRSRSDTDLFVFNRNNLIDKGIISYYYPVFRPKNVDSNFLLRRLNNGIRSQVSMAAEGTGQHVLAHSKLKNMEFLVPSVPEQKLIGAYFEILDHLITLHQSELEKLQKIKKSLLERMFV